MLTPLHIHSSFSFGWGSASPEALCQRARAQGHTHLALTDRNGLHGVPEFLEEAWRAGLTPVLGASLERGTDQALVLAEGREGWAGLCGVASGLAQRPEAGLVDLLAQAPAGLNVASPDLGLLKRLSSSFPQEQLYAELRWQPGWLAAEANAQGFQVLATAPVHFLDAADHVLHRLLRAIHLNRTLARLQPKDCAPAHAWFQGADAALEAFAGLPDAVANAAALARRCGADKAWFRVSFPGWTCPDGGSPAQILRRLCREGIPRRFGPERAPELDAAIEARLSKELGLIEAKGFVEYFLVVREIVLRSPRTCGRGSGAASLVAFLLGITQVDPLALNLYFERFLNPGREDYPDLDIDFAWDERDQVQAWALTAFGEQRAALVANHVRYQPRMALRETAKVFGLAPDEIKRVTSAFGWFAELDGEATVVRPKGAAAPEQLTAPWPEVFSLAARLIEIPRLVSVHCGGIVITAGALQRHAAVQWAAKELWEGERSTPLLQWDKDGAEAMGLVKIDLLGNRSLAVIRDALRAVEAGGGPAIDEARFRPLDDPGCQALLNAGDTVGCFYIESPATRLTLKKAGSIDFETLVVISSIIRPAAHRFIEAWLERRHGGAWVDAHPILSKLFPDTFGIPVYQENVNQLAEAVAGFDVVEADRLRKVLGKKSKAQVLADFKARFFSGGRANGYAERALGVFWEFILSFEGYSFCKPHSASFALVSYQSVWLRAHHPAEFMAAVLSNHGGFYRTWAYVSECRRMGLQVLAPDVNQSRAGWTGSRGTVRVGLAEVAGLSRATLERLLRTRQAQGPFNSVEDFLARCSPAQDEAQSLVHAGALDGVLSGLTRPQALWMVKISLFEGRGPRAESRKASENTGAVTARGPRPSALEQGTLNFDAPPQTTPPELPEFDTAALASKQLSALGFLPGEHNFASWRREGRMKPYVPLTDLGSHVDQRVRFLGLSVTRKEVQTRKREDMCFASFEDDTALAEAVLFPDAHKRYGHLLELDREPLVVDGVVRKEWGVLNVEVECLSMLK